MTKEEKQDFTRRIAAANRSGLLVIKFEMSFLYLDNARAAHEKGEFEQFKIELTNAEAVLHSFLDTLDFEYEIAGSLFSIYTYCLEQLAKARLKRSTANIQEVHSLLYSLYEAFLEAEKQDTSMPVMKHSQQIYAGMTYGKDQNPSVTEAGKRNRGFLV
ncbi:MAG: flagellar protein FliS [Lachnospiraceae bacterium]